MLHYHLCATKRINTVLRLNGFFYIFLRNNFQKLGTLPRRHIIYGRYLKFDTVSKTVTEGNFPFCSLWKLIFERHLSQWQDMTDSEYESLTNCHNKLD